MDKNKKRILIVLSFIIWISALYLFMRNAYNIVYNESVSNNMGPFESIDSSYELCLENSEYDGIKYTSFHVRRKGSEEIVFDCHELFETSKLRYITWKEGEMDIIIMSADAGFITYEFFDGSWVKE